jgi:steroid delta-isomerase-like uncharacterized protein
MAMTEHAVAKEELRSLEELAYWGFGQLARRDLSAAEEIWAPEAIDHFLPVGDAIGRDAIVAFFTEMFEAFPDFHIEPERVLTTDTYAVVQWRATGTFTGKAFHGIRPTGRGVAFRGCDVVEIRDRLVHENTIYWDGAAFARQIGLLPREGSWADRAMLAAFNAVTWLRTLGGRRLRARAGT